MSNQMICHSLFCRFIFATVVLVMLQYSCRSHDEQGVKVQNVTSVKRNTPHSFNLLDWKNYNDIGLFYSSGNDVKSCDFCNFHESEPFINYHTYMGVALLREAVNELLCAKEWTYDSLREIGIDEATPIYGYSLQKDLFPSQEIIRKWKKENCPNRVDREYYNGILGIWKWCSLNCNGSLPTSFSLYIEKSTYDHVVFRLGKIIGTDYLKTFTFKTMNCDNGILRRSRFTCKRFLKNKPSAIIVSQRNKLVHRFVPPKSYENYRLYEVNAEVETSFQCKRAISKNGCAQSINLCDVNQLCPTKKPVRIMVQCGHRMKKFIEKIKGDNECKFTPILVSGRVDSIIMECKNNNPVSYKLNSYEVFSGRTYEMSRKLRLKIHRNYTGYKARIMVKPLFAPHNEILAHFTNRDYFSAYCKMKAKIKIKGIEEGSAKIGLQYKKIEAKAIGPNEISLEIKSNPMKVNGR